jgi:hypothetical protein
LRRPAARKETGAQDRQANPDPPANGKAPRTWCVCQWPNEVHASALCPSQGGVCPPPSLQGACCNNRRCLNTHRTALTMMTLDKTTVDALASYTGTVTRGRLGRGRAPEARQRGQAQFQCVCGHAGTMPYPTLFKRLQRGRRLRKPLGCGANGVAGCCAEKGYQVHFEPIDCLIRWGNPLARRRERRICRIEARTTPP